MTAERLWARDFHPSIRDTISFTDYMKGPKHKVDGWPWYELTVQDIMALRKPSYFAVMYNSHTEESFWMLKSGDRSLDLPVPSRLQEPSRRERLHDMPYFCDTTLHIYPSVVTETSTILNFLRPKDRIRMLWWEDGDTNGCLRQRGMYADFVRLEVDRGDTLHMFRLANETGSVSSAGKLRMIRAFDPAEEPFLAMTMAEKREYQAAQR